MAAAAGGGDIISNDNNNDRSSGTTAARRHNARRVRQGPCADEGRILEKFHICFSDALGPLY